jgi:chemotaxis protein methyltransferase CheR
MSSIVDETQDFDFVIQMIYDRTRIRLHEGKHALIRARLGKRMRHFGFQSLGEYCHFLRCPAGQEEITHAVDALTTNFTQFLREENHFQFLVNQALPPLLQEGKKRIRIWSAACATGEDPYSLALYLAEHFPLAAGWDWQILASDISTKALGKAREGIYSADRVASLPPEWLRRYFLLGTGSWAGHYRVKPALASRIQFEQINLLGQYRHPDLFQVVFCRNVMIYFDRPTQEQLGRQLSQCLIPGGYLIIGHSESLTGLSVPVKCLRPSIYQKN